VEIETALASGFSSHYLNQRLTALRAVPSWGCH
jgi:hypothetical protein